MDRAEQEPPPPLTCDLPCGWHPADALLRLRDGGSYCSDPIVGGLGLADLKRWARPKSQPARQPTESVVDKHFDCIYNLGH